MSDSELEVEVPEQEAELEAEGPMKAVLDGKQTTKANRGGRVDRSVKACSRVDASAPYLHKCSRIDLIVADACSNDTCVGTSSRSTSARCRGNETEVWTGTEGEMRAAVTKSTAQ